MENKKLLKFLLKDLSELEELVAEKESYTFDAFEVEFLKARLSGANKLVRLLYDKEKTIKEEERTPETPIKKLEEKPEVIMEEEKKVVSEPVVEEVPDIIKEVEEEVEIQDHLTEEVKESIIVVEEDKPEPEPEKKAEPVNRVETDEKAETNKRLGDSFAKEQSVNDLLSKESKNLEHKLSNRPVSSIQSAIGINDRFQFIRELFEGNAEKFTNTIAEIDAMKNRQEAVQFLQENFQWQKNPTSLKFVNLVKRRFPHE